jgi:hypothetical protein
MNKFILFLSLLLLSSCSSYPPGTCIFIPGDGLYKVLVVGKYGYVLENMKTMQKSYILSLYSTDVVDCPLIYDILNIKVH